MDELNQGEVVVGLCDHGVWALRLFTDGRRLSRVYTPRNLGNLHISRGGKGPLTCRQHRIPHTRVIASISYPAEDVLEFSPPPYRNHRLQQGTQHGFFEEQMTPSSRPIWDHDLICPPTKDPPRFSHHSIQTTVQNFERGSNLQILK